MHVIFNLEIIWFRKFVFDSVCWIIGDNDGELQYNL